MRFTSLYSKIKFNSKVSNLHSLFLFTKTKDQGQIVGAETGFTFFKSHKTKMRSTGIKLFSLLSKTKHVVRFQNIVLCGYKCKLAHRSRHSKAFS